MNHPKYPRQVCGEFVQPGPDGELQSGPNEALDTALISMEALSCFMPPGQYPIPDFFDICHHAAALRTDIAQGGFLTEVTTFTLRASYERIRELEQQVYAHENVVRRLNNGVEDLKSRLNVPFVNPGKNDRDTYMQIVRADTRDPNVGLPQTLQVKALLSSTYGGRDSECYGSYILLEEKDRSKARTWPIIAMEALASITFGCFDSSVISDDLAEAFRTVGVAVRQERIEHENLGIEIRKLCGVEESSETTTLEAVQGVTDYAHQLSLENVRLREQVEAYRKADTYIHPRRYVEHLESTLLAIGKQLGHKTFPAVGTKTPYQHQMHNYCSRLLQAVRTRMTNKKGSK